MVYPHLEQMFAVCVQRGVECSRIVIAIPEHINFQLRNHLWQRIIELPHYSLVPCGDSGGFGDKIIGLGIHFALRVHTLYVNPPF